MNSFNIVVYFFISCSKALFVSGIPGTSIFENLDSKCWLIQGKLSLKCIYNELLHWRMGVCDP